MPSTSVWTNSCGPENRAVDVRLGGEVDDRVAALRRRGDRVRVGDVALLELVLDALEVRPVPGVRQLVEDDDLVPAASEAADEVRADEAGAAGDEHAHRRTERLIGDCRLPGGSAAIRRRAIAINPQMSRHSRRPSRQCGSCGALGALAAQDRVRGPRRRAAELRRRDPPDAAVDARLLEDRLGELGPGAVAVRCEMPDAARPIAVDELARRGGEVPDVGRAAALVVHHGDLVALGAEPQHRADEVVPGRAEEPRAARRSKRPPRRPPRRRASSGRRPRADSARRTRRTAPFPPVEDVVARERHERRAERGGSVLRSADVHRRGALRIVLGAVHVGPGGRVQHEIELRQRGRRQRHVPVRVPQRKDLVVRERLCSARPSWPPAPVTSTRRRRAARGSESGCSTGA